jgi:octopine/nopaline transport system permease protein
MHIDFDFLLDTLRQLFAAVPTTLGLFFSSLVLGGLLSLVIVTMRVSPHWLPNRFARAYILVFRGSPLLIQMFLVYYGLGQFGVIRESFLWPVLREPYMCAVLSLALCTAGYTAEIIRGGLMAVPVGQIEAGYAIGLSGFALLRRVIGPIALRQCLPAYSTYRTTEVFICAALIYLFLNFIIVRLLGLLEVRLSRHLRAAPAQAATRPVPAATEARQTPRAAP